MASMKPLELLREDLIDEVSRQAAAMTAAINEVVAGAELADDSILEHPMRSDEDARARKVKIAALSVTQNTAQVTYLAGYIAGVGHAIKMLTQLENRGSVDLEGLDLEDGSVAS